MFVNRYVHSLLNHNRRLPLTIWLSSLIDARKERKISDKVRDLEWIRVARAATRPRVFPLNWSGARLRDDR